MRYLLLAVLATGCIDPIDPRWQLDHDHVVAVRATPPRILPHESAELDALVAHDGAPTTIEIPAEAATLEVPPSLEGAVYTDGGRWFVYGPAEYALVAAREELGLPEGAPVPIDVYMAFPRDGKDPLYAKKTVWLGAAAANPPPPEATIDGAPMAAELVVPPERDVFLSVRVGADTRVSWLSSCGTLFQDDVATSFLRVLPEDSAQGELAVVIRAPDGGVAWRVWPIRATTAEP